MKSDKLSQKLTEYHGRDIEVLESHKVFLSPQINMKARLVDRPEIVFDAYYNSKRERLESYLPFAEWAFDFKSSLKTKLEGTPVRMKCKVDYWGEIDPKSYPSFEEMESAYPGEVMLHAYVYFDRPFLSDGSTEEASSNSTVVVHNLLETYNDSGFKELYLNMSAMDNEKLDDFMNAPFGFNAPEEGDLEHDWESICLQKLVILYRPEHEVPTVEKLYELVTMDVWDDEVREL